jgi:hypothetical protein
MRCPRLLASVPLMLMLVSGLALTGCTNQASTEPGDSPADAGTPSSLGNGLRIHEMNAPDSALAPANDQMNVTVTGATFLTLDDYAEVSSASATGSIYVEDFHAAGTPGIPYSGIDLYKATYEPASLVLAPGDVIDFTGEYQLYDGPASASFGTSYQPEMYEPIITFRFDYSPPAPTVIDISDLGSYAVGSKWMSMLVQVQNLEGGGGTASGGRCSVFLTTNTGQNGIAMDNELFNLPCTNATFDPKTDAGQSLPAGSVHFKSVTGIVTFFESFTISPRSLDDIVLE